MATSPLLSPQYARPAVLPRRLLPPPPTVASPATAERLRLRVRRAPGPAQAKFGKFDAADAPVEAEPPAAAAPLEVGGAAEQAAVAEDDSCLPSDLEGAIWQSGKASADFVNAGGMRGIVCSQQLLIQLPGPLPGQVSLSPLLYSSREATERANAFSSPFLRRRRGFPSPSPSATAAEGWGNPGSVRSAVNRVGFGGTGGGVCEGAASAGPAFWSSWIRPSPVSVGRGYGGSVEVLLHGWHGDDVRRAWWRYRPRALLSWRRRPLQRRRGAAEVCVWRVVVLLLLFGGASPAGRGGEGRGLVKERLELLGRSPAGSAAGVLRFRSRPRSVLAGCSFSGVLVADDGGSFSCFSSSSSAASARAWFQEVRGVSPAVVVQCSSSRRPCARRVSSLVPQLMLPWSLGAELLIPQLEFLNEEGAQAEVWALSRILLDTLAQETGQKVKAIFPDAGVAALLKYQWKDAQFKCASLSDRKPVDTDDGVVVMIIPDHQMLEAVERIASQLADDPIRPLVMWNPRLVSGDVGVGYNVRNLRRNFLSTFTTVYSMRPLPTGAIFRCYPEKWKVFYDDPNRPNRYLLARESSSRPDATDIEIIFGGGGASENSEEEPSMMTNVMAAFSSVSRFMRVISK